LWSILWGKMNAAMVEAEAKIVTFGIGRVAGQSGGERLDIIARLSRQ
jgi:hypothetical protein